jgi:RND superfamily putative drug exporter
VLAVSRVAGLLGRRRVQLVDLRAPVQWRQAHIPGARNIATDALADEAITFDRELPVVFYGNDEPAAVEAAEALRAAGMTAYALAGGLDDWVAAGRPVEPTGHPGSR